MGMCPTQEQRNMWSLKLRAAAIIPALVRRLSRVGDIGSCGAGPPAGAAAEPAGWRLHHGLRRQKLHLSDECRRVTRMPHSQSEVFIKLLGLPLATSPVTPAGFTPGIVQLLEGDGSVSDQLALRRIPITNRYSVYFISNGASALVAGRVRLVRARTGRPRCNPGNRNWQDVSGFFNVAAGHIYVQIRGAGAGDRLLCWGPP